MQIHNLPHDLSPNNNIPKFQNIAVHQMTIGSPKNIRVNVLDGNKFFTLDYQNEAYGTPEAQVDHKNYETVNDGTKTSARRRESILSAFDEIHANQQKYKTIKKNQFMIKNIVRSAQYSRKFGHFSEYNTINHKSRNIGSNYVQARFGNKYPYTRIKKVENLIKATKQRNKIKQHTHQQAQKQQILQDISKYQRTCPVKTARATIERKRKSNQHAKNYSLDNSKEKFVNLVIASKKQYEIDSSEILNKTENETIRNKSPPLSSVFTQNYKNRRKLADRFQINHKNNKNVNNSPLSIRWGSKLKDAPRQKHYNPFNDKILLEQPPQQIRSIQGSKIQYSMRDNNEFKRYNQEQQIIQNKRKKKDKQTKARRNLVDIIDPQNIQSQSK